MHFNAIGQLVLYDLDIGCVWKEDNTPLGADNGAGCWLLAEMAMAGVEGHYVWHQGEEKGGIGSSHIKRMDSEFLTSFHRAVAFDRRKNCSVITRMGVGKTCSDEFADALIAAMPSLTELKKDTGGTFTDTANYREHIPECTNVSVGYDNEHSPNEVLDLEYLAALRDAAIQVPWNELPTVRDPKEKDAPTYYGTYYPGNRFGPRNWDYPYDGFEEPYAFSGRYSPIPTPKEEPAQKAETAYDDLGYELTSDSKALYDAGYVMPIDDPYEAVEDFLFLLQTVNLISPELNDATLSLLQQSLCDFAVANPDEFTKEYVTVLREHGFLDSEEPSAELK